MQREENPGWFLWPGIEWGPVVGSKACWWRLGWSFGWSQASLGPRLPNRKESGLADESG